MRPGRNPRRAYDEDGREIAPATVTTTAAVGLTRQAGAKPAARINDRLSDISISEVGGVQTPTLPVGKRAWKFNVGNTVQRSPGRRASSAGVGYRSLLLL